MKQKIKQAIILAAGLGTRLRPLTLTTPKPLLPLDSILLIDHQIMYLASAGVTEIAINLHHLGEKISDYVGDGSKYGVAIHYSKEKEILGTGGGVKKAGSFFGNDLFIVLNADALLDVDIAKLIQTHLQSKAAATMVCKELVGETYNPVEIDKQNFVIGFGKGRHFYNGLQILGREMLDVLPKEGKVSCLIKDGYMKLIENKRPIKAFINTGYANDLGTMERYIKAREDIEEDRFKLCTHMTSHFSAIGGSTFGGEKTKGD